MTRRFRNSVVILLLFVMAWTGQVYAKTTITMWLSSQPLRVNDWAKEFEKSFNEKNPDIELKVELYPDVTAQRQKLIVAVAGGVAPDIVYDSCNLMSQWVNSQIALPLDKYFNTWSGRKDVMPDLLNWLRFDNQLWGMPYSVWSIGDLYNMDVFAGFGVSKPSTWDEMITTAKRLRRVEPDSRVSTIGYNMAVSDLQIFVELQLAMEQNGSTVIDVGSRTANLNTNIARQALAFLHDVAQAGNPGLASGADVNRILRGEVGVYHSFYGYSLVALSDTIKAGGNNLEYRRFVGPKVGSDSIQGNGGMLYITQASRNPDMAWRVLQSFMDKNNLKGYLLAHGAALPARMSMHSDNDLRSMPWAKELMSVLSSPIYLYGSRHPYATDFRTVAGAHIAKAIKDQVSMEEALMQAQTIINQIVGEKMGAVK